MNRDALSAEGYLGLKCIATGDGIMAYADSGKGDPVVFLHGNLTSSYLWRNITPHVDNVARCLAPDLMGMGCSSKIPGSMYRYVDHRDYLDAWFEMMDLHKVVLVMHGWGSVLGVDWARRNEHRVQGISQIEPIVSGHSWEDLGERRKIYEVLRSQAGEQMVLQDNFMVERLLPAMVMRRLTDAEMDSYRRPYLEAGESRRPTLTWAREIPINGEPMDVAEVISGNLAWLLKTEMPKLFLHANPGVIMRGHSLGLMKMLPGQDEVIISGSHLVHEDSPDEIGGALASFVARVRA